MALLALIAASLLRQPPQDVKVDFECAGAPVPQLVADLAKASGVALFAPTVFKSDVVVLRVEKTPLKDVMARLADLCAAEWQTSGGGFQLVVSPEKRRAEQARERKLQIAGFDRALEKERKKMAALRPWGKDDAESVAIALSEMLKSMSQPGDDGSRYQALQAVEARSPSGRAMTRILGSLDPRVLADLPDGDRVVFSTAPTRMQRPMPGSVISAMSGLAAEQNSWAAALAKLPKDPNQRPSMYSSSMESSQPYPDKVGKVLLAISKRGFPTGEASASLWLYVADPKGHTIVKTFGNLSDPQSRVEPLKPKPNEPKIEASPYAKAIMGVMDGNHAMNQPLPAELRDKLLNPEKFEPLALVTGDALVRVATSRHENLAALLPDYTIYVGAFAARENFTASMFLQSFAMMGLVGAETNGWLEITPQAPTETRRERADRSVLGRFLRATVPAGRADLDALSTYAASIEGDLNYSIGFGLIQALLPRSGDYTDGQLLRFYGQLTPATRQALEGGQKLVVSSLGAPALETLRHMIYGSENGTLQPIYRPGVDSPESQADFYNGILHEPTEILGDGIPSDSTMEMPIQSETVLLAPAYVGSSGANYGARPMGAGEVAQMLLWKEKPEAMPGWQVDPDWDKHKFNLSTRRELHMHFTFADRCEMRRTLTDTKPSTSPAVPYDQLPADFRKQVKDFLDSMRKYNNGGESGGGTPPPGR